MCNCIKQYNDQLKEQGLALVTDIGVGKDGLVVVLVVHTRRIDPRNRKAKPGFVQMIYCPFCGEKKA